VVHFKIDLPPELVCFEGRFTYKAKLKTRLRERYDTAGELVVQFQQACSIGSIIVAVQALKIFPCSVILNIETREGKTRISGEIVSHTNEADSQVRSALQDIELMTHTCTSRYPHCSFSVSYTQRCESLSVQRTR